MIDKKTRVRGASRYGRKDEETGSVRFIYCVRCHVTQYGVQTVYVWTHNEDRRDTEGGSKTWSETAGAYVQSSRETLVANLRNVRPIQE